MARCSAWWSCTDALHMLLSCAARMWIARAQTLQPNVWQSSPSDAGCSDPYLSIDNTGTISDRKDCSPYGTHYGLSGWSGACSGGLHFPHSNGYWYIVKNQASHGTKG